MRSTTRHGGSARGVAEVGETSLSTSSGTRGRAQGPAPTFRRARRRRTVTITVFAAILGLGIAGLLTNKSTSFPLFDIALIALGGINCATSIAALVHLLAEHRMQEAVRRDVAADPVDARAFDQTNGVVDLGHDAQRAESSEEIDRARRLSSMNAAGIAYGNGTR